MSHRCRMSQEMYRRRRLEGKGTLSPNILLPWLGSTGLLVQDVEKKNKDHQGHNTEQADRDAERLFGPLISLSGGSLPGSLPLLPLLASGRSPAFVHGSPPFYLEPCSRSVYALYPRASATHKAYSPSCLKRPSKTMIASN